MNNFEEDENINDLETLEESDFIDLIAEDGAIQLELDL